jgi:hypothetical protein
MEMRKGSADRQVARPDLGAAERRSSDESQRSLAGGTRPGADLGKTCRRPCQQWGIIFIARGMPQEKVP